MNKAYWPNPWSDKAVAVPLDKLISILGNAGSFYHGIRKRHQILDAYILRGDGVFISVGIRFGSEPEEYYSPYAQDQEAAKKLLEEYEV